MREELEEKVAFPLLPVERVRNESSLKDNIQPFPIPDSEDVYPVAELLLKKQTEQKFIIILLNIITCHPNV